MAFSISLSLLPPSATNRLLSLSSSSPTNHRSVAGFPPPTALPRRRSLIYGPRCSSTANLAIEPSQSEDLMEELICAISEELSSMDELGSVESLHEALSLVDLTQRLGIHRFFKIHIQGILESAYKQWDEKYGLIDANATVLGFHLLRLQGYNVHGDVLKLLIDKDGINFSAISSASDKISRLLNLYKCSQISFPNESEIMKEALHFSVTQLNRILSDVNSFYLLHGQREEIEFSLAFPRQCRLSQVEAINIARRSWPSSGLRRKCLELACIDLEILQKLYQYEIYDIKRWLEEQQTKKIPFPRSRLPKLFVGAAMSLFEPQFSFYRTTFAKICCLVATMDDLFDLPSSDCQGLHRLQEAFQSWDASPLENFPEHKAIFKSFHQNLTDIAAAASTTQKRDVLPYLQEVWQDLVAAFTIETEWRFSRHIPSFAEYLPVGVTSVTAIACLSTLIFTLGEPLNDEALKFVGKDSRMLYLASIISRLSNDIATNEREKAEGKFGNAIGCYMKDHPKCKEEDAIMVMKKMIQTSFQEMEQEMFECRGMVPECCIRAVFGWVQAFCISYRKLDGYKSNKDTEYEELVKDYLGY